LELLTPATGRGQRIEYANDGSLQTSSEVIAYWGDVRQLQTNEQSGFVNAPSASWYSFAIAESEIASSPSGRLTLAFDVRSRMG
jgi:hypothetical protein